MSHAEQPPDVNPRQLELFTKIGSHSLLHTFQYPNVVELPVPKHRQTHDSFIDDLGQDAIIYQFPTTPEPPEDLCA